MGVATVLPEPPQPLRGALIGQTDEGNALSGLLLVLLNIMLDVALDEVTNQVGVVDLSQVEVAEGGLGEVAESVVCTLVRGAIGFQQGEAFDMLGAVLRLHIDFQLAEVLLVLHIGNLKDMSTFRE